MRHAAVGPSGAWPNARALWNARPEARLLPALWEWVNIRLFTRRRDWTPPQAAMMRTAGRRYALRAILFLALLAAAGWGAYEGFGYYAAASRVEALASADTAQVPRLVAELRPYRRWADSLLSQRAAAADPESRERLHMALALAPTDAGQVDYLFDHLLTAEPDVIPILRDALNDHRGDVTDRLWAVLEDPRAEGSRRLRAAAALAAYQPDSPRWGGVGSAVAARLVKENPIFLGRWTEVLRPAQRARGAAQRHVP